MDRHSFFLAATYTSAVCIIAFIAFEPDAAFAAWGVVHADFSGCPAQYASGTADEPAESEAACNARINAITKLACARYTCVPNASGAPSAGGAADPTTLGMQDIAKGIASGNSQAVGIGFMGVIAGQLINGMQSDPAEDARRAQAQAQAAEQARLAEERHQAEVLQQQEQSKQRILGMLKGSEAPTALALKTDDSNSNLVATQTAGAFGSTAVVPTGVTSGSLQGLALKLDDNAERESDLATRGFDRSGKLMGGDLSPPPPTPSAQGMTQKTRAIHELESKLKKNQAEEQLLKDHLAQLQQAPTPDPVAIKQTENKIAVHERDKKKIQVTIKDLTATDDDTDPDQPSPQDAPYRTAR